MLLVPYDGVAQLPGTLSGGMTDQAPVHPRSKKVRERFHCLCLLQRVFHRDLMKRTEGKQFEDQRKS